VKIVGVFPEDSHPPIIYPVALTKNAKPAPLNLVYVAHGERMQDVSPQERRLYASVDSGFIGQNVYLFCASEGLGTVFRGAVDYDKLSQAMQLGTDQFVTFAQTVGYLRS
jgi:nitroreductase